MHQRPPQSSLPPPGQANRFCYSVIQRAFGSLAGVRAWEHLTETSVTETLTFYLDYNSLKTVRSLCTSVLTDGRHSQSGSQHPGVENMFNRTEEKVVHITGMFLKVFYLNLHLALLHKEGACFYKGIFLYCLHCH